MSNGRAMNEKHLEMIQAVIERLSQNSFAIKGWAVTFVSAICALATDKVTVAIGILPALVFWGLDAFYLRQERLYRQLYEHAQKGNVDDFSMEVDAYSKSIQGYWRTWITRTIFWLYFPISALAIAVAIHAFISKP